MQIPFWHFAISTAIGLQPTNIVFVQAGASLGSLRSWKDLYGPRSITLLTLCLLAALLPIIVRRHWLKVKPGELFSSHAKPCSLDHRMLKTLQALGRSRACVAAKQDLVAHADSCAADHFGPGTEVLRLCDVAHVEDT